VSETSHAELLTVADAYTPDQLRKKYRQLCFSGIYAFYVKSDSLPVAPEYVQHSYQCADGSGFFLLYIGQARKTSDKRFLGVRCNKHCGGVSYQAQSQLRLGLCAVMLESWNLKPCFKVRKKDGKKKFIWLNPQQKDQLTKWCDDNVLLKVLQIPDDLLDKEEQTIIQRHKPLLNTEHSSHPFTPVLKEMRQAFLKDGRSRPYL
jgi:hypothetical protein